MQICSLRVQLRVEAFDFGQPSLKRVLLAARATVRRYEQPGNRYSRNTTGFLICERRNEHRAETRRDEACQLLFAISFTGSGTFALCIATRRRRRGNNSTKDTTIGLRGAVSFARPRN